MRAAMISACERYFDALNRIDRAAFLACFAPQAEAHDPYGGRPAQGEEGLNKWFSAMERTWDRFQMTPAEYFVGGDRVAVQWSAEARAKNGKSATFSGVNVFTLAPNGEIARLEAYWDAAAMMAQIS
ncbi:MAG: nuclear transport factor 2 family protein [Candidatus Promineifilaceae bacterium]